MGNSQGKSKKRDGPPGLENIGMSGYMNPVLQCMASIPPVAMHFTDGRKKRNKKIVAGSFAKVIWEIHNDHGDDVVPTAAFCRAMGRFEPRFDGRSFPQDAQEFFTFLLDALAENSSDSAAVREMFWGKEECPFTCKFCGDVNRKPVGRKEEEEFKALYVDLPERDEASTVTRCLEDHFSPVEWKGESLVHCPACNEYREATSQLAVTRLPPVLVINLRRSHYDDDICRHTVKRNSVDYKTEGLDVGHMVKRGGDMGGRSGIYDLCGAVFYRGGPYMGQYWAVCRRGDRWYRFVDEHVTDNVAMVTQTPRTEIYALYYCAKELMR